MDAIKQLIDLNDVPERSLKRRFKAATGDTLIGHLQNLRIEEAKKQLEQGDSSIEEVSEEVGYMDISFFRRLFKRLTGLSPGQYRRMFKSMKLSEI
jgi:transcriptional regulator GlxA family with amidase domain